MLKLKAKNLNLLLGALLVGLMYHTPIFLNDLADNLFGRLILVIGLIYLYLKCDFSCAIIFCLIIIVLHQNTLEGFKEGNDHENKKNKKNKKKKKQKKKKDEKVTEEDDEEDEEEDEEEDSEEDEEEVTEGMKEGKSESSKRAGKATSAAEDKIFSSADKLSDKGKESGKDGTSGTGINLNQKQATSLSDFFNKVGSNAKNIKAAQAKQAEKEKKLLNESFVNLGQVKIKLKV